MKKIEIALVEEPAVAPIRDQARSTRRILVVDDDSDARQLTVDLLIESGYDVEAVKDGAAAWEILQANRYDLIITDNKMPKMTGIEMIEKLHSASIAVPVIMATGYLPTLEFARKPWLRPGVTLEKPFSNEDLIKAVKKILPADDGSNGHKEGFSQSLPECRELD